MNTREYVLGHKGAGKAAVHAAAAGPCAAITAPVKGTVVLAKLLPAHAAAQAVLAAVPLQAAARHHAV